MPSYSSTIGAQMAIDEILVGSDYQPARDSKRLGKGYQKVKEIMSDGLARSPDEIAMLSGQRLDSALRFVRLMRKQGYIITKDYKENGLYLYSAKKI